MSETTILVWLRIEQDGAVLLGRRKADAAPFAGLWVLPGDAMPEAESASETIGRAARELLDVRVTGEEFVDTLAVSDAGREYLVNLFQVTSFAGRPRFRQSGPYAEVRWVPPDDLRDERSYPMPPALRLALTAVRDRSVE